VLLETGLPNVEKKCNLWFKEILRKFSLMKIMLMSKQTELKWNFFGRGRDKDSVSFLFSFGGTPSPFVFALFLR
jgi:hypothetical protein